ncbi:hypothetical protein GCM10010466_00250 [Planomonospora alba]|uniref:Uncharacterized protein n=1 Tax=Planomonospora alba TaxID=161354 RepID=A0ABP6MJ85_9ACTN
MTFRAFLVSLTATACALPVVVAAAPVAAAPAAPAVTTVAAAADHHVAIRSITLRPANPVVHPDRPVRLVIEVVARGVSGRDGVTIKVEPGAPPASARRPGREQGLQQAEESTQRRVPGWRTWRFLPERRLTRWYPTGLWTVTAVAKASDGTRVVRHTGFRLRHATDFSALEVGRADGAVRVSGVLNRVDPQGYLDYAPFPRQRVEIMYRPERGGAWRTVATDVTDRTGRFTRTVRDHRNGQWRVRFPGTGRHAPELSAVHRIG